MAMELEEKSERLPLLDPKALNPDQKELYCRIAEKMLPWAKESGFKAETEDGKLLGPFNAMVYSPELGAAQLDYLAKEQAATCLEARTREVVILTVGAVFQSSYELDAHGAVAAKAGLAAADIDMLATGREPGPGTKLTENEVTAHRFVWAVAKHHRVSPEVYAEALKAFGHKGLVDVLHLAGIYMAVSTMLNAFEVPVPA